jgi:3-hydroxyisobutyrate dehydrogenase-like beta-hydroxyacid dehydrogenase
MGSAIAERLLAQGHRLTVWNRTAGRAAVLVTRDVTQATTPPIMFNFAHPVAANWRRAQKTCALHESVDGASETPGLRVRTSVRRRRADLRSFGRCS